MKEAEAPVLDCLASLGIAFDRLEHEPVFSVEDAERHWQGVDAAHCKNLFLRNQKGDRHYLAIVSHLKRVDLRQLAEQIGDGKLSFASPERLRRFLGLLPGAVSPFGLLNDPGRQVRVFLDKDLTEAARISFHPNHNEATLVLAYEDFRKFLTHVGHEVRTVSI